MNFLEYKEPYIVKTERIKNRTHQSYRWKQKAAHKDLSVLLEYARQNITAKDKNNYRIIDSTLKTHPIFIESED